MEAQIFQIVDISSDDISFETEGSYQRKKKFIITLYGINQNGDRVVCHVDKYYPYFYLRVPDDPIDWDTAKCGRFLKDIQDVSVSPGNRHRKPIDSLKAIKTSFSKEFYGFQWDFKNNKQEEHLFYKIIFENLSSMKHILQDIRHYYNDKKNRNGIYRDWIAIDSYEKCDSNIYESFVHPVMRFIHDSNIEPTGWVKCQCNNKIKTNKNFEQRI